MRPQNVLRSLRLLQHSYARSCLGTAPGRRYLQTHPLVPDFAFAFDIDGVLLRSSKPIPGASDSLAFLQNQGIPFILLTNGGGKHEVERVADLSNKLNVPLDTSVIVQSHTPFAELVHAPNVELKDKCVLVVGGDGGNCQKVAEKYGFKNVVTPGDIFMTNPAIWPYSKSFINYYEPFAKSLGDIYSPDSTRGPKIDAIFVFNDSRDWGLDIQVIIDVLTSSQGIVGTVSDKNNRPDLPNRGFQQDGQPPLYFDNPDLVWASSYHLPRLGQGAFREALEGIWAAITGGPSKGVELKKTVIGKPSHTTYEFAERQLLRNRVKYFGEDSKIRGPLRKVYMVGDNPQSDIRGANSYKSCYDSHWHSILVRTGVYSGGEPAWKPSAIVDDVRRGVEHGLVSSRWPVSKV